jgi:iron complex transport system substrate-binding protein
MIFPERIVCLTEETTETLYLLGEQDRIVGISGYTVRPPEARRDKPRVSAFTSARIDRILALQPDLVLGFSDLQADIAAALIRRGVAVHVFNQRDVAGILAMVRLLGAMVGAAARARRLADRLAAGVERARARAADRPRRPRVFFEEWDDPLITGIGWVSELIGIAGGEDCFAELAHEPLAQGRIVSPAAVVERRPDIVIGSWCGKRFRPDRVAARAGFAALPAVERAEVHEIKSSLILQPGPAALTDGLAQIERIIDRWARTQPDGRAATGQRDGFARGPGRRTSRSGEHHAPAP